MMGIVVRHKCPDSLKQSNSGWVYASLYQMEVVIIGIPYFKMWVSEMSWKFHLKNWTQKQYCFDFEKIKIDGFFIFFSFLQKHFW